jgi:hypothetical protein
MVAIYQISNEITGQCYIGSSSRVISRWGWHLKKLQAGHHNNSFQKEWNNSQLQDWSFRILSVVPKAKRSEEEHKFFLLHRPELNGDRNRFTCIIHKDINCGAILQDIHNGLVYREISKKYNVSLGTISNIRRKYDDVSLFT